MVRSSEQSQKAVTVHFTSIQFLPFGFADCRGGVGIGVLGTGKTGYMAD